VPILHLNGMMDAALAALTEGDHMLVAGRSARMEALAHAPIRS
jgi:hypothetical protein